MKHRSSGRPGFTMVELLTVIAIIAILAAIIFPVFSTVRRNVWKTSCTANMHTIAQALKMYKDDYKVYPDALYGYEARNSRGELFFQTFLYPQYVRDKSIFRCPIAPERSTEEDPRLLVPTAHPVTGAPVDHRYFLWDSYDGGLVPHPNGQYQLRYVRHWSGLQPGFQDDPRQLIYRNPPDNTVVTWCTYHRFYQGQQPEPGSIDLVLFLDGHVKPTPSNTMLPAAGDPAHPYKQTK
jgi:prepilin-type N-terminal cleavage/methylation domain-containing protein